MTEKYYTPVIEEFHVGFEYEEYLGEWKKTQFVLSASKIENSIFDSMYEEGTKLIRVKYLDKEDIESCRWRDLKNLESEKSHENTHGDIFGFSVEFIEVGNLKFYHSKYKLRRSTQTHGLRIVISNDLQMDIFNGFIKNKSELKRIMKQLNIA